MRGYYPQSKKKRWRKNRNQNLMARFFLYANISKSKNMNDILQTQSIVCT